MFYSPYGVLRYQCTASRPVKLRVTHGPTGTYNTKRMKRILVALAFACSLSVHAQPRQSMFVFQNNFWLNLHQFVRGEAYRHSVKAAPGIDPASLDEADRAVWTAAVDAYTDLAKRNVVFDDTLRRIANALAMVGDVAHLPDSLDAIIGASTTAALNANAPIYRARLWPARQRDNNVWIASAKALIDRHETAMAASLAAAYHITWPSDPILVDAVGEIGPNSAVTHGGPAGFAAHTQAGAASPRNTGDAPLELLFHEAAHAASVEGRIMAMINDESARQKLQPSPNLWHAMIMFTSGAVARRELAKAGGAEYVPYAYRYSQYTPAERSAFESDWQPYLDGRIPLEQALHDLVRDSR
jgi:hypothetical protein